MASKSIVVSSCSLSRSNSLFTLLNNDRTPQAYNRLNIPVATASGGEAMSW
ncbi:MAG: hypothetical protein J5641_01350 [Bacteroidales bacterium]|nr:hypothetical protein [Bacteroidales bacterium]